MRPVETVSFLLPPKIVELVHQAVQSGEYGSTSEVVSEAVREWSQNRSVSKQGAQKLQAILFKAVTEQPWVSVESILASVQRKYQAPDNLCSESEEQGMAESSDKLKLLRRDLARKSRLPDDFPSSPCIYAVYITDLRALAPIKVTPSGLLYVGRTTSSLKGKDHLCYRATSSFSLRQTLGAILKHQLRLEAIPRRGGDADGGFSHYEFTSSGEQRLKDWMVGHLTYGFSVAQNYDEDMKPILTSLQPPLNLSGWNNPQKALLGDLRQTCRKEASHSLRSEYEV